IASRPALPLFPALMVGAVPGPPTVTLPLKVPAPRMVPPITVVPTPGALSVPSTVVGPADCVYVLAPPTVMVLPADTVRLPELVKAADPGGKIPSPGRVKLPG